jgi:Bacterial HORMA domain family 1
MSSSATQTATESYTTADIENVVRRFTTDLRMIADSSGTLTRSEAEDYGEDIEYLAKKKYLEFVDITLFVNGEEERAVRYTVDTSGTLTSSRPGGVLWPRKSGSRLGIIVRSTQSFWLMPSVMSALNISWTPTNRDLSHSTLKSSQGRAFVSTGFAFNRKDYSK